MNGHLGAQWTRTRARLQKRSFERVRLRSACLQGLGTSPPASDRGAAELKIAKRCEAAAPARPPPCPLGPSLDSELFVSTKSSSSRLPSPPGSLCLQLRQRPWLASSLRSQRAIDEPGKRHTAITAYGMWSRQLQRRTITSSAVARTSSSFNSITRMKSWHRGSSLQEGMD